MGNNKYVYNVLPGLNLPTVLRRFVLWMGDKNYGMCFDVMRQADTHDPSQSPGAFSIW